MVTDHPWLGAMIMRSFPRGKDLPDMPATVGSPVFNDRKSADFYADAVIVVGGAPQDPAYSIIVEPQQAPDPGKLEDWPRYATALWVDTGKPVFVLVFCKDQKVADWYGDRQPIGTNLGNLALPLYVVGPAQIPAITDPGQVAEDMAMGVLSFTAHGSVSPKVVEAFKSGLTQQPPESQRKYYELAHGMSSPTLRHILEDWMASDILISSPFGKETFAKGEAKGKAEGKVEGKVEGEAEAILIFLEHRGLTATQAERERISGCADIEMLRTWVTRAATVTSVGDLFA